MKTTWLSRTMLDISLPVADAVFTWSNILLVVGTVMAFVGTAGVFWSTGIRERYADERIAANEAETARAKADAEQARLEQVRLRAQMAWRRISSDQAKQVALALARHKTLEVWVTFVGNDPEAMLYREDVNAALTSAGLKTKFYSGYARAVGVGVRGGTPELREEFVQAFKAAGVDLLNTGEPSFTKNELEVLVGSKPPPDFQK